MNCMYPMEKTHTEVGLESGPTPVLEELQAMDRTYTGQLVQESMEVWDGVVRVP